MLYKVIIVDDDRIIRRGLKSVIPWKENGFTVVGEAGDGEEGLALIEREQPHIVLSDIKMPFMNGLEMARRMREKKINSKIILLTGYEDFQYAHEALKIRAFDYLLKPVETELLIEKMTEAKKEWDHDQQKDKLIDHMIAVQQEQFMKKWILNTASQEEINSMLKPLESNSPNMIYYAWIIQVDVIREMEELAEEMKEGINRIIRAYLDYSSIQYVLLYAEKGGLCLLIATNLAINEADHQMQERSLNLVEWIQRSVPSKVTITRGSAKHNLTELRESVVEAKEAFKHRYRFGPTPSYSIHDLKFSAFEERLDYQFFIDELIQSIKLGMKNKVMNHLHKAKEQMTWDCSYSFEQIYILVMQTCNVLLHDSVHWMKDFNRYKLLGIQQKMLNMQTIEELFESLEIISVDMAEYMHKRHLNQKSTIVDKAMRFIEEYFYLEELSLQRVADEVHVSPTYLSSLFKAEKGFNFGDYLMECRMNQAMKLFRETDLKTYEIADKTGYSNPRYFSSSFKKYTGHSPAEFRKLQ